MLHVLHRLLQAVPGRHHGGGPAAVAAGVRLANNRRRARSAVAMSFSPQSDMDHISLC